MSENTLLDHYPEDAGIREFHSVLAKRGRADVFSPEHAEFSTYLLSQRPAWKGKVFPAAWAGMDNLPWPRPPALDVLVVDNCRRIVRESGRMASALARDFRVGWFTSPIRRLRRQIPQGCIALDPAASLGGKIHGDRAEFSAMTEQVLSWRRTPLGRMHLQLTARAARFIAESRVKAVFLGSDGEQFGTALGAAAGSAGVPVFVLQHGVENLHNYFGTSSHLFCWSEMVKDHARQALDGDTVRRCPDLKLEVAGGIHTPGILSAPESATVLFLDQVSRYGDQIWGTRWIEESRRWLASLARDLGDRVRLLLRTHPGFDQPDSLCPAGWEKSQGLSLKEDIQRASVVLTMNSTAGLEAGAMGRPTYFLRGPEMVWLGSLSPLSPLVISSPEELTVRVEPLLQDSVRWRAAADEAGSLCRGYLGAPETTVAVMEAAMRAVL